MTMKLKDKVIASFMSVVLALGLCPGFAVADEITPAPQGGMTAQAVNEIPYDGDEMGFYAEDLTSPFGMISPEENSLQMSWSDGMVTMSWTPSNKTVYCGLYLNAAITDITGTYPQEGLSEDSWIGNTDGTAMTSWSVTLPDTYCGYAWPVAPVKTTARGGGSTSSQYYLAIPAKEKFPGYTASAAEPVTYELKPINDEKMYVVVKVVLEDNPGEAQDYMTYYLNGSSYGYGFGGGQDEAVAQWDFDAKAPKADSTGWAAKANATISGEYVDYQGATKTVSASKPGYRVPVSIPEGEDEFTVPVVAYASDFTARRFDVNLADLTVNTGSASDTAALTVTSSVADVAAAGSGSVEYTGYVRPYAGNQNTSGNPLSNDFVGELAVNLGDNATYDRAYAVTYKGTPWLAATAEAVDPAESDYADVAADGALALPFYNEYDTDPKTAQLNGNVIKVMMHVADSAPYEEAGTWVERTFQLDFTGRTAGTLAISGDALTPKAAATLEDGIYTLPNMVAGSSQMFNHMEADSRLLIVSGDKATIVFIEDGSTASVGKYSRLALGKTSEILAGKENYCPDSDLPEGTTIIEGVEQDKTAANARWRFDIELPKADVEAMLANGDKLYVTVWNNVGSSSQNIPGWYIPSSDIYLDLGAVGELTTTQKVSFVPQDAKTGAAIEGATVTVTDSNEAAVEATDGVYNLTIGETYTVALAADDYRDASVSYTAKAGEDIKAVGAWHKNYYYWMQIRGAKPVSEQTYSIHGTGEVVKLKTQSTGEEVVIPVPEGTYYVLDNLQVGETYTVSVDAPEGYALVTNGENGEGEWSVEQHGYVRETDGETHWERTFTVTDEKEFLGNIIVNFVEYTAPTDVDWTAVDNAIAKVPGQEKGSLDYFTEETAEPVTAAVNAVDRTVTEQAAADAMAAAIEDALKGLVPKDGRYEVTFDKANGTPYYYYEDVLAGNEKEYGMGVLVVENGEMSLDAVLKNTSYAQVYVGTKEEAAAAAPDENTAPEGAINIEMDTAAKRSTVTFPVAKFNEQLQYAFHSSNSSRYNMKQGWYDHGIIFRANTVTPLGAEESDVIELSIYDEELMFKVVNAYIEKTDEGADFVFALSAKGYEFVYAGTFDEAWADLDAIKAAFPNKKTAGNLIYYAPATVECVYDTASGTQNDGTAEKYQFRMPITDEAALAAIEAGTGTFRLPITAISNSRANAGNWDAALTARQAAFDLDAKSVRTGNYKDEFDATVSSELETMTVDAAGKINTIGTPSANEYTCQPTFKVTDGNYDAAFIGTAEAAATATKTIAVADDGTFVIPLANSLGKTPQIDVETWQATVAFHVPEDSDFNEAGTWVERTLTVNPVDKTIAISGNELTMTIEPVEEFPYDGDAVNFIKDDGTGFGMLAPQDGTTIALEGDNVVIHLVPKNKTTYVGFYLGGDNRLPEAWDEDSYIAITDGAYEIALPADEYCGFAWPVAVVKSDKVTTPSAQYYLAIPAKDKIVVPDADYSAVESAKAKVPADLSVYTDETAKAVEDAVAAVVDGKKIDEQADVDAMAQAIEDAIAALEKKPADYSAVESAKAKVPADLSIYTDETAKAVEDAVAAVVDGKKIDEQADVDAMAKAIEDAVAALAKKPADYAKVDAAKAEAGAVDRSLYTDATLKALDEAVKAVVEGKKIDEQADVDAMAKAIEDAVAALEKKPVEPVEPEKANKDSLNDAIADAKAAEKDVATSTDGKDVAPSKKWVTADAKKALDDAIAKAQAVANDENATQDDVDKAAADVKKATSDFNAAKKAGTKSDSSSSDSSSSSAPSTDSSSSSAPSSDSSSSSAPSTDSSSSSAPSSDSSSSSAPSTDSGSSSAPSTDSSSSSAPSTDSGSSSSSSEPSGPSEPAKPVDIAKATIAPIAEQPYAGKAIEPTVTVTLDGKTLVEGKDYEIAYANNDAPGTATVTVTGKGEYEGTATATFEIAKVAAGKVERLWGETGLDTMAAIVEKGDFPQGGTVVLTTFDGYWDALTSAGIAGLADAPVLMTEKDGLSKQTAAVIKELSPKTIIICGGPAAVPESVEAQAKAVCGSEIVRAWGADAIGTAIDVFVKGKGQGAWTTSAFICTNDGYWDALAAAPLSYALHMPIFLTEGAGDITDATLAAMKDGGIQTVYVCGGPVAIDPAVEAKLAEAGFTVEPRLAGQTAVETSEAIAAFGVSQGMTVNHLGVATNDGYWDALSGAAFCGRKNSVLVLAGDENRDSVTNYAKKNAESIADAFIFGGKVAVSEETEKVLEDAIA